MPRVGDKVLILSEGNYSPFAWAGEVADILGPRDFVLKSAALLPRCGEGNTWSGVAANKGRMRQSVRVRVEPSPVEVYGVQCCRPWVGDLPTDDAN